MDTQIKILRATLKLASSKGLEALSLDDVARECEIKKASLYYYFSSRDELIKKMLIKYAPGKEFTVSLNFRKKSEDIILDLIKAYGQECVKGEKSHIFKILESARFYNKQVHEIYLEQARRRKRAIESVLKLIEKRKMVKFKPFDEAVYLLDDFVHIHLIHLLDGLKEEDAALKTFINAYSLTFIKKGID